MTFGRTLPRDFYTVLAYVHTWGVDLRLDAYQLPLTTMNDKALVAPNTWVSRAPFNHACIEWGPGVRRIWWSDKVFDANALMHELAHCVAAKAPTSVSPHYELFSEMLGFEYYSTRHLRIGGWSKWMNTFGTPWGTWALTPLWQRGKYIADSLRKAAQRRLLTPAGRPTPRPILEACT